MKTKHRLTVAAIIAAATYARSAHAGVSFQVSVGWPAPVYVEPVRAPVCGSPPVVRPSRVSCVPPVVVRHRSVPAYRPVHLPPGHVRKHYKYRKHHGGGFHRYDYGRSCRRY